MYLSLFRKVLVPVCLVALFTIVIARDAGAQGFISPTIGYNFGGDSGCLSATDCDNKNWNLGVSLGALGPVVGFEAELMYEGQFIGDTPAESSTVLTGMANLLLAPKFGFFRPYGLVGFGLIHTSIDPGVGDSESENQVGWDIGGGLMLHLSKHVGLKGDVRYYHSFQVLDLIGIDFLESDNKLDFGRFALGVVFTF